MRSARPVKPGDRLDAGGRARRVDGGGIAVAVIGQGAGHDHATATSSATTREVATTSAVTVWAMPSSATAATTPHATSRMP